MLFLNTSSQQRQKRRQPIRRPQPAGPKKLLFSEQKKVTDENPDVGKVILCMSLKANCTDIMEDNDNREFLEITCQPVNIEKRSVMGSVFHAFVLPVGKLNEEALNEHFIKNYKIGNAENFPTVYAMFEKWLAQTRIVPEKSQTIVENAEIFNVLCESQFNLSKIAMHWAFKNPLDVRDDFIEFYKSFEPKEQLSVFKMCELMYMKSEGKPGECYEEVFNLGMIVAQMLRDGFVFQ